MQFIPYMVFPNKQHIIQPSVSRVNANATTYSSISKYNNQCLNSCENKVFTVLTMVLAIQRTTENLQMCCITHMDLCMAITSTLSTGELDLPVPQPRIKNSLSIFMRAVQTYKKRKSYGKKALFLISVSLVLQ